MKHTKKFYLTIGLALLVTLSTFWFLPSPNPIPASVRQELTRLGEEYTQLTLEQARIQKLKLETSNTLNSYATQEQTYADALKANADKQAQIKAQYIGIPDAKADTSKISRTYAPGDLFYTFPKTWKDSGLVYVSQSQKEHFLRNGMLAVDIGTSGQPLDLFAPDYHNSAITYRYKRLDSHHTLGRTIKLEFPKEDGDKYWLIGHVHSFALDTGGTVSTGQPIGVTGGCEDSIQANKVQDEGASTGCHVHIELWKDGVRLPYPETTGVQHTFTPVSSLYTVPPSAITDSDTFESFPGTSRFAKVPRQYVPYFEDTAKTYEIPVKYLLAVASYETHFRPDALSGDGGCGMFQFTSWKNWGFASQQECLDPAKNLAKVGESWSARRKEGKDWPEIIRRHNGAFSYGYQRAILKAVDQYYS